MKHARFKSGDVTPWLEWGVYGLALIVLLLAIPFPSEARKVFYFTCGLAGIGWALDRKRPDNEILFLLAALAVFALYRIVQTVMEAGTFSPEIDALQVYLSTANRFLMGLLLIGYLSTRRHFIDEQWFRLLRLALVLSLLVTAGTEVILQQDRIEREQRATIFAYEVVAVYFAYLGLQLTRYVKEEKRWKALAGVGLLALGIVLWTETRTALFCLFIGGMSAFALSGHSRRWKALGTAALLGVFVLACCYSYAINPRLMEAYADVTEYVSGENRATSIGTRLELWHGSVLALAEAPLLGSGYQKRAEVIDAAVEQHRLDPIAAQYSQIHMHNELLEELSLRGVVGGALLLLLYFAVATSGWRAKPRNLALLGVLFTYVFSGLTDVLFFSREATVLFITLLAVLVRQLPPRDGS